MKTIQILSKLTLNKNILVNLTKSKLINGGKTAGCYEVTIQIDCQTTGPSRSIICPSLQCITKD